MASVDLWNFWFSFMHASICVYKHTGAIQNNIKDEGSADILLSAAEAMQWPFPEVWKNTSWLPGLIFSQMKMRKSKGTVKEAVSPMPQLPRLLTWVVCT